MGNLRGRSSCRHRGSTRSTPSFRTPTPTTPTCSSCSASIGCERSEGAGSQSGVPLGRSHASASGIHPRRPCPAISRASSGRHTSRPNGDRVASERTIQIFPTNSGPDSSATASCDPLHPRCASTWIVSAGSRRNGDSTRRKAHAEPGPEREAGGEPRDRADRPPIRDPGRGSASVRSRERFTRIIPDPERVFLHTEITH